MKLLLMGFIALCVFACNGMEEPEPGADLVAAEKVQIPFREHGYRNFNTAIFSNKETLAWFLGNRVSNDGWNKKDVFVSAVLNADIDYAKYNLLLYRITEGSGSIGLQPMTPTAEGDLVAITIARTVPDVGTADMAYYALAYKIKKDIEQIHVKGLSHDEFYQNKPELNIAPSNCTSWFDGCNWCSRSGVGIGCTKKSCGIRIEPLNCMVWE